MSVPCHRVGVGAVTVANDLPLVLIAGPCQLESRQHALDMAGTLGEIAAAAGTGLIYKTSFDKANRTSGRTPRGPGPELAAEVFLAIRRELAIPVLTDVHLPEQCALIAPCVDVLQIPAFLCRQTDLLQAAARTGLPVNIKKGQFLAPGDMAHAADKVVQAGNDQVLLCERGSFFGYRDLVVDFRSLAIMARTGWPVVLDVTHAVQQPGAGDGKSGGQREYAPLLARAGVAAGIAAVFVETHQDPDNAPSDGPNMIPLRDMPALAARLAGIDRLVKGRGH